MATRTHRGWFQCPDSGDEVVVEVFAAPCRARCRPTSGSGDPEMLDTDRWCDWFNEAVGVGYDDAVATLRSFGVGRRDINWED